MRCTIARKAIAFGGMVVLWVAGADVALAKAPTILQLKRVQVADGSRVALVFDGNVDLSKIKTEFFNEIIQLSMSDVSVYPAKISSVAGTDLAKVFAYQYAPGLTRCRFTVRGKAEDYKGTLKLQPNGKMLTIEIAQKAAQTAMVPVPAPAPEPVAVVSARTQEAAIAKADPVEKTEAKSPAKEAKAAASKPLAGGKPLPSPWRAFSVLGGIVTLLLALAWLIRRARGDRVSNHAKFPRFAKNLMKKFGQPGDSPMTSIQVVATHALGPKKSISVVRVAGRTLVLGVTDDAINLISELADSASADDIVAEAVLREQPRAEAPAPRASRSVPAGAVAAGPAVFADIFQMAAEKPAAHQVSNRSKIRSRLEGMKEL
jgi:flagellar biogenesis protein FliO